MRILLLSYYFPHINVVSSDRTFSWAECLSKYHSITVVTRHFANGQKGSWSQLLVQDQSEIEIKKGERYDVHYLPSKRHSLYQFKYMSAPTGILSSLSHLFLNATGNLNSESDAHRSFYRYAERLCSQNEYDLIIVSSPPLNMIKLGAYLSSKFRIKLQVDMRDLWHNDELKEHMSLPLNVRILNSIKRYYVHRWIQQADLITTVSEPIAEFIHKFSGKKCSTIRNGFNEQLYANKNEIRKFNAFSILFSGTYYPAQDLSIFSNGFNLFYQRLENASSVNVILLGVNSIPLVSHRLKSNLPTDVIIEYERKTTTEAALIAMQSHVIVHCGWKGYKGIYTTKLFDFIASGANLMIAPGDGNVMDETVMSTNTGVIANSAEEVCDWLYQWYQVWVSNGSLESNRNEELIAQYSRTHQAERLKAIIDTEINNGN